MHRHKTAEDTASLTDTEAEVERVRSKFAMATCFEFRMRAHSFDLHTLSSGTKLAKLSKRLFRSRSDSNVKSPAASPAVSPKGSPSAQPKRRFMRVVRDGKSAGEEYENPHIIRKYTQEYVESEFITKSLSLDDSNLPYTVTGHTILKKHSSLEDATEGSPPLNKHASFKEEVEIIEYDKKQKIEKGRFTRRERLHDSDSEYDSMSECGPIGESEEEGDFDKENELPLDPKSKGETDAKEDAAKAPAEPMATDAKRPGSPLAKEAESKQAPEKIDTQNTAPNEVPVDDRRNSEDISPPCSPTSCPDKLIPLKKTRMCENMVVNDVKEGEKVQSVVTDKKQIDPKETPRIEDLVKHASES